MGYPVSIEHIVVLLFENRSFDHVLGFLPHPGQLTGKESCPVDPSNPQLGRVPVDNCAPFASGPDPHHDLLSVNLQLFGDGPTTADPAPLNGFVKSYTAAADGDAAVGATIMHCFDPARLPALTTLAREYCLCDRWFSSVPGPTWPNRFFIHAATSDGVATNDVLHPFDMETIYDSLESRGLSWNIYYHDFPHSLALRRLWNRLDAFRKYTDFTDDAQRGLLPNYSFIEPRYFELLGWRANDFHPPHDVRYADELVADVYRTLRASSLWEKTLLVVAFDEHGGYYEHISPPRGVPNPDNQVSVDPPFDFTRLGLRVPAIVVSPWIEKGCIDSTVYEHASVPATTAKIFGLDTFLTTRDRAANTFERVLTRAEPRADAPLELPTPEWPREELTAREAPTTALPQEEPHLLELEAAPLSEFQESLVHLSDLLVQEPQEPHELGAVPRAFVANEQQGAMHVQEQLNRFLK